jgi:hypothetical protein
MIIKAGYRLSVTSWENDADNYQTHSIDGLSEEKVKNLIKLVSLFESSSNSKNKFGNLYEPSEEKIEKMDAELIKFNDVLGYKHAKNDEDHINYIKEKWLSELGIYSSGEFYTRVFGDYTVEYTPTEIVIEDVTEKFKGK